MRSSNGRTQCVLQYLAVSINPKQLRINKCTAPIKASREGCKRMRRGRPGKEYTCAQCFAVITSRYAKPILLVGVSVITIPISNVADPSSFRTCIDWDLARGLRWTSVATGSHRCLQHEHTGPSPLSWQYRVIKTMLSNSGDNEVCTQNRPNLIIYAYKIWTEQHLWVVFSSVVVRSWAETRSCNEKIGLFCAMMKACAVQYHQLDLCGTGSAAGHNLEGRPGSDGLSTPWVKNRRGGQNPSKRIDLFSKQFVDAPHNYFSSPNFNAFSRGSCLFTPILHRSLDWAHRPAQRYWHPVMPTGASRD